MYAFLMPVLVAASCIAIILIVFINVYFKTIWIVGIKDKHCNKFTILTWHNSKEQAISHALPNQFVASYILFGGIPKIINDLNDLTWIKE